MLWPKPQPALAVAKAILIDYPVLPATGILITDPTSRPDKYVVLDLLPGSYPYPSFTEPRVMANCYAKTKTLASDLGDDVLTAFLNARGVFAGAWVKKFAEPRGPYELKNPDISDRFRFQVYGELRLSTR